MKGKLIIDDNEFEVELDNKILKTLNILKDNPHEKVEKGEVYYYIDNFEIKEKHDFNEFEDKNNYMIHNYYNNRYAANVDLKVDILMKKLRHFIRKNKIKHEKNEGYYITYKYKDIVWEGEKDNILIYGLSIKNKKEITIDDCIIDLPFTNGKIARTVLTQFYDDLVFYFEHYYKDFL